MAVLGLDTGTECGVATESDFIVNQIEAVSENSVDVTSDKTAVRFCAFFWLLFFAQTKKSDWPAGHKHGHGERSTKNKAPPTTLQDKNTV